MILASDTFKTLLSWKTQRNTVFGGPSLLRSFAAIKEGDLLSVMGQDPVPNVLARSVVNSHRWTLNLCMTAPLSPSKPKKPPTYLENTVA